MNGGVATLWLDRPDVGNALSRAAVLALAEGMAHAQADPGIHTIVFRGRGANFCTGFDLSSLESETDRSLADRFLALERLLQSVWYCPKRTVAFATGKAWGAGADLFASCDVRAASADATLRFPGSAFGIVLGTRRLVELIGWDAARPLVTEGTTCNAEQARRIGLCTELVEGDAEAWLDARCAAPAADPHTFAAIRHAVRADHRAADMVTLRASAERPGLKARIEAYRERVRAARPRG